MQNQKRSLEICCYVLGAGAFSVFLRWLQVMLAFDDKGLSTRSAFNLLVPAMIIAGVWTFNRFTKQFKKERLYVSKNYLEALYNPGRLFAAARWLIGVMMCAGAGLLLMTSEADKEANLIRILCAFALCTGASFPLLLEAANRFTLEKVPVLRLFAVMPILMYSTWLILSYKQNVYNSVFWSFAPELLTIIVTLLAFFRAAGLIFNCLDEKKLFLSTMSGAMLCLMSLADSRYMGMEILLLSSGLMLVFYDWVLIMNLKTKGARRRTDEEESEGGFEKMN